MNTSRYKIVLSLLMVFVLAFMYVQQEAETATPDKLPDATSTAEINTPVSSPKPNVQQASSVQAVANAPRGDELSEKDPPQGVENLTDVNNGTISLDEILSRVAISQDSNVFPQQYQVDIATTALLTDAISYLDKDELELHVFSAECYEILNECRVHYQANDSLVLHLMGDFEGMIQIGDHITESGDTMLMIGFKPIDTQQEGRADN